MTKKQADPDRYTVIDDETGEIANIVLWDGKTEWVPGHGRSVRKAADDDLIGAPENPGKHLGSSKPGHQKND